MTKISLKFQQIEPTYDLKVEAYSDSQESMLAPDFATSIKIKSIKQIGCGGQANVFKC